ncbi:MAG: imidazoleglycerol-phosphate dehydratase HisB [Candidatus Sumerlaeia bacterium]
MSRQPSQESAPTRTATVERRTKETQIRLTLALDGDGRYEGAFGIPFFEHMLDLFTHHGFFDLRIEGRGDIAVDPHHTVEDVGICLGQAFQQALGDMKGIVRFGHAYVPMEETLGRAVVDVCNRPYLRLRAKFASERLGNFDTELVEDFFNALAMNARITLHLECLYGRNTHHVIEALFKAAGRALGQATQISPRIKGAHSTKGVL